MGRNEMLGKNERKYRDSHTPMQLAREGQPTRGDCWYNYDARCWIFPRGMKVPAYMEREGRDGRIVWSHLSLRKMRERLGEECAKKID